MECSGFKEWSCLRPLLCVIAVLVWGASATHAQQSEAAPLAPLQAPRTDVSEDYLTAVRGNGLQIVVPYLHPDSDLDADLSSFDLDLGSIEDVSSEVRWTAAAILLLLFGLLLFLIIRNRGSLSDRLGPRSAGLPRSVSQPDDGAPDAEIDRDLIARLRAEEDPRAGLRLVLQRFLKLAAEDNAIVIKRSLTTRELIRRLPGSWHYRSELETLARRAELAVFGGREISRADYEECLDLAAPFLRRTTS